MSDNGELGPTSCLKSTLLGVALILAAFGSERRSYADPIQCLEDELNVEDMARARSFDWVAHHARITTALKRNIIENLPAYQAALQAREGHALWLRRLGFEFEGEVRIPSVQELVAAAEREARLLAESGAFPADEVPRAAAAFRLANGQLVAVPFGEPVPAGAKHVGEVISSKEWFQFLDQGLLIFGNHLPSNDGRYFGQQNFVSVFEHDLAHLTSYFEHPEYYRHIRKLVRDGLADGLFDGGYQGSVAYWRFYYASESVALPRAQGRDDLAALASTSKRSMETGLPDLPDLKRKLGSLSASELRSRISRIETLLRVGLVRYGGAARDLFNRHHEDHDLLTGLLEQASGHMKEFDRLEDVASRWTDENYRLLGMTPEEVRKVIDDELMSASRELARFEVAYSGFKRISLAEWTRAASSKDPIDRDSSLYKLVCKSRVWTSDDLMFKTYCN